MAEGSVHYKYYKKIFFPIIIPVVLLVTGILFWFRLEINPALFFAFCFFQYWLASFIDPDSDLATLTDADGRMMRTGKKITRLLSFFGYLNVAYWFMYTWLISLVGGHRSFFSHSVIISTAIRILYFNIPLFLILSIMYKYGIFGTGGLAFSTYMDIWLIPYLLSQFIIWSITDATHLILDKKRKK